MKTKYIKVSVVDRLPKENKKYLVGLKGIDGLNWLAFANGKFYDLIGKSKDVEFWLDEIPDREEEMREMLDEYVKAIENETIIIQENEDNEGWENFGGRFFAKAKKLLSELKQTLT